MVMETITALATGLLVALAIVGPTAALALLVGMAKDGNLLKKEFWT